MNELVFQDLAVGRKEAIELRLTEAMLSDFSNVSGDASLIHTSSEFAKNSGFKDKVVHGLLLGSIASRLIGMKLPGKYGILHSITLNFHKPCYAGDTIIVEGEISEAVESVKTVVMKIRITRKDGELLVMGKAQIGVAR